MLDFGRSYSKGALSTFSGLRKHLPLHKLNLKRLLKFFLTVTAELRTFGVADVITEEMHCFVIFVIGNQRGSILLMVSNMSNNGAK
jgi:hypothetical protein